MTDTEKKEVNFYSLLLDLRRSLEPIKRESEGQVGTRRYKYADLASIQEGAYPVMYEKGFVIIHNLIAGESGSMLQTELVHAPSGERLIAEFKIPACESAQQAGSWITYGRRYNIVALLDLTVEDDDGNQASQPKGPQTPKNQQNQNQGQAPNPPAQPAMSKKDPLEPLRDDIRKVIGAKKLPKNRVQEITGVSALKEITDEGLLLDILKRIQAAAA